MLELECSLVARRVERADVEGFVGEGDDLEVQVALVEKSRGAVFGEGAVLERAGAETNLKGLRAAEEVVPGELEDAAGSELEGAGGGVGELPTGRTSKPAP